LNATYPLAERKLLERWVSKMLDYTVIILSWLYVSNMSTFAILKGYLGGGSARLIIASISLKFYFNSACKRVTSSLVIGFERSSKKL